MQYNLPEMIALADLKLHLNLTGPEDDALIQGKIDAASTWVLSYTGLDDADAVPAPVLEATRQLAASWYETREGQEIPSGVISLLRNYRAWCF